MDCNSIQEKISSFIDDRLSPEEKVQVDEHLKACPDCRSFCEELKKTVAFTGGLDELEPPPWLGQKVMAHIREGDRRKQGLLRKLFFPLHIKVPLEIVATLAIAVTAFFVFRTIEPEMKTFKRIPQKTVVGSELDKGKAENVKDAAKEPSLQEQELTKPSAPPARLMRKSPLETAEGVPDRMKEHEETADIAEEMAPEMKAGPEGKTFAPGAVLKLEAGGQRIEMIVHVHNIESSSVRIEEAVKKLHGEIISKDRRENKLVLSVMLDPGIIRELIDELKSVGEVQDSVQERPLADPDRKVEVKIEVMEAF